MRKSTTGAATIFCVRLRMKEQLVNSLLMYEQVRGKASSRLRTTAQRSSSSHKTPQQTDPGLSTNFIALMAFPHLQQDGIRVWGASVNASRISYSLYAVANMIAAITSAMKTTCFGLIRMLWIISLTVGAFSSPVLAFSA